MTVCVSADREDSLRENSGGDINDSNGITMMKTIVYSLKNRFDARMNGMILNPCLSESWRSSSSY